jgi:hypothetical protein
VDTLVYRGESVSTYYVWVCDERKEYIDPYPKDKWHLFEYMYLGPWSGCSVRLITDAANHDEYYGRTSDPLQVTLGGFTVEEVWGYAPYKDVTADAMKLWEKMNPAEVNKA